MDKHSLFVSLPSADNSPAPWLLYYTEFAGLDALHFPLLILTISRRPILPAIHPLLLSLPAHLRLPDL